MGSILCQCIPRRVEQSLSVGCFYPPSRSHFRHVCSSAYENRQSTRGCAWVSAHSSTHVLTFFCFVLCKHNNFGLHNQPHSSYHNRQFLLCLDTNRFRLSRNRHRHISKRSLSIYGSLHLWNIAVVMFVRARFWLARCAESAYLQWLVVLCFHMMYPAESYVETTHSPKQVCVLWAKGDKTHPDNKRQQATMIVPLLLHVAFPL